MLTLPTKILAVSNTSTKTEGSVVAEVKVARSNLAVGTLLVPISARRVAPDL